MQDNNENYSRRDNLLFLAAQIEYCKEKRKEHRKNYPNEFEQSKEFGFYDWKMQEYIEKFVRCAFWGFSGEFAIAVCEEIYQWMRDDFTIQEFIDTMMTDSDDLKALI